MNIRPIVETSFIHYFSGKVDKTTVAFKKAMEWAVFDCEAAVGLLTVRSKKSVIDIIEAAIKSAEQEFKDSGELQ